MYILMGFAGFYLLTVIVITCMLVQLAWSGRHHMRSSVVVDE